MYLYSPPLPLLPLVTEVFVSGKQGLVSIVGVVPVMSGLI